MKTSKQERVRVFVLANPTASVAKTAAALSVSRGTVAAVRRQLVAEGLRPGARNSPPVAPAPNAREGSSDGDVDVLGALEARLARAFTAAAVPEAAIPELVAAVSELAEQLALEVCREVSEIG